MVILQKLIPLVRPIQSRIVCVMSSLASVSYDKSDLTTIVPSLTHNLHKGQCGRIAVIGGSLEYTGAPYFAAMTALRLGADLAHVFCMKEAGSAIKSYSPDLIVHPILDGNCGSIKDWLPRMHAVVVGPGLGRDMCDKMLEVLTWLKRYEVLTVIDADGLHIVTQNPEILCDWKNVIVTPNIVEYDRLLAACRKFQQQKSDSDDTTTGIDSLDADAFLTRCFPDLLVVRKGPLDKIFDGVSVCEVGGGSARRCGGQGDVLAGAIAVFSYWSSLTVGGVKGNMLGAYAGCYFTRRLNEKVFAERGRSMVTGDFIEKIGPVFQEVFDDDK